MGLIPEGPEWDPQETGQVVEGRGGAKALAKANCLLSAAEWRRGRGLHLSPTAGKMNREQSCG